MAQIISAGNGPIQGRYLDIPVLPDWRETDSVSAMTEIMREHEHGMFMRSAMLVEEMMTDDRISGVLSTRIGGLLCADLTFNPADERRKSQKLARILGGADETQSDGEWLRMLDFDTAFDLLKWKIMLGVAVAEIVWDPSDGEMWRPRLNVWHPRHLYWNVGSREFILLTSGADPSSPILIGQDGYSIHLPRTERGKNTSGHWFVWGRQYSWLRGAVRPLAMKYLDRTWNERDWARYCEKHGLAIIVGKAPMGGDVDEKREFEDDLDNIGSETTIIVPQAEAGQPSYDVDLLEATSKSWETFQARKKELDVDIAITLLGQNLTTEVKGGSLAAASIHEGIRIDKKKQDAEIFSQVREQVLIPWASYNYGIGQGERLAPYPQPQIAPPEDEESEANALLLLGNACQSLLLAYPGVDVRAILETRGVPIDEDIAAALEAVKGSPEATPVVPPKPGDDGQSKTGEPAASGDDKKPSAEDGAHLTTAFLTAIARLKASRSGGPTALKRVAKYHDAVVERARRKAGTLLGTELEVIREDIEAATDFPDLKRRIVKRFKFMKSPKELAALIERVNVLGHQTGRLDVLQGL
jgi:phage gp29-like protein